MTHEEMEQKVAHIERVAELQKKAVYREFVESNAKYKIGDIVGDKYDTIRVERISYSVFHGDISIYYYGPLLTKKGEPRKDGVKRNIFESVIKSISVFVSVRNDDGGHVIFAKDEKTAEKYAKKRGLWVPGIIVKPIESK